MNTVRLSSKGHVVIPARWRRSLRLKAGQVLRIRKGGENEIVLSPVEASEREIRDMLARARDWARKSGRDLVAELHLRRQREG